MLEGVQGHGIQSLKKVAAMKRCSEKEVATWIVKLLVPSHPVTPSPLRLSCNAIMPVFYRKPRKESLRNCQYNLAWRVLRSGPRLLVWVF